LVRNQHGKKDRLLACAFVGRGGKKAGGKKKAEALEQLRKISDSALSKVGSRGKKEGGETRFKKKKGAALASSWK